MISKKERLKIYETLLLFYDNKGNSFNRNQCFEELLSKGWLMSKLDIAINLPELYSKRETHKDCLVWFHAPSNIDKFREVRYKALIEAIKEVKPWWKRIFK